MKKWNNFLNILMGAALGAWLGRAAYLYWEYRTYPGLYAMQSAPWYTGLIIWGIVAAMVILAALLGKLFIRKRKDSK